MTNYPTDFLRELQSVRPFLKTCDWTTPGVTNEKALVAAVFAKTAYMVISQFETRNHAFAKIIPCLAYQRLLASGVRLTGDALGAIIRDAEIECEVFIEDSNGQALIAAIQLPEVIFVALRGTRLLYLSDWMIDLDFRKSPVFVGPSIGDVNFHNGFFVAISTALSKIEQEIRRWNPASNIPVYVAGHSLGGAMATIAHGLDGRTYSSRHRQGSAQSVNLGVTDSYCFGMPRCGDADAATRLCNPIHIYNSRDIVPHAPPRRLGFNNVTHEYRADNTKQLVPRHHDGMIVKFRGVRHHLIERYLRNLRIILGIP